MFVSAALHCRNPLGCRLPSRPKNSFYNQTLSSPVHPRVGHLRRNSFTEVTVLSVTKHRSRSCWRPLNGVWGLGVSQLNLNQAHYSKSLQLKRKLRGDFSLFSSLSHRTDPFFFCSRGKHSTPRSLSFDKSVPSMFGLRFFCFCTERRSKIICLNTIHLLRIWNCIAFKCPSLLKVLFLPPPLFNGLIYSLRNSFVFSLGAGKTKKGGCWRSRSVRRSAKYEAFIDKNTNKMEAKVKLLPSACSNWA